VVTAIALLFTACATPAARHPDAATQQATWAAQCADDSGWDDPGPPFKVFGNTYYVGTCGIGSILVTGDSGHVLIDSGTGKGADLIAANIRALGFDPRDVEVLLMTHEHGDHIGGMARLQQLTGARLLASPPAAEALASGKATKDDPQFAIDPGFVPARVDGQVHDGAPVTLGNISLTPVRTPGHTPGATSWQWRSCEGAECRTIVYADSLSPVSADSYKFSEHPAYLADFRRSLARLAQLDCDILLTPHPSASAMHDRLAKGALEDKAACKAYAADRGKQLDERIAKETGGQ
jgi:metallo-beta-lactamase class B